MVPHRSKVSCDLETAWQEGKGSDSRSETQIQLCDEQLRGYVRKITTASIEDSKLMGDELASNLHPRKWNHNEVKRKH